MSTAIPATNAGIKRDGPPSVVLFDLDGTLVDPAGGITGGLQHALAAMDLPVPSLDELNAVIGPKLADALVNLLGVPAGKVEDVIAAYRAWYGARGMAMSVVYPGVEEVLAQLQARGVQLAVATQKPEPLAKVLLAHHGLDRYFVAIRGSHADETLKPGDPGYRPGKTEIIAAALAETAPAAAAGAEPGQLPHAVMVGDRHQDVHGAAGNGLECVGVAWGFAADGELAAAGARAVVQSAEELLATLTATAGEGTHGDL
ncbi:phosphoglycolate phosphatase [Arthrobacter stackebrandtii]|uniref:Phosphoglycolate phosphatase n=1 Tax=Arthrobacter stackebrandtii TaxID=272161 RepID=A0ABS4Z2R4_9MICC|nr:phosphoglycolate phosphatase [Arthrobacter stackebrandtii]